MLVPTQNRLVLDPLYCSEKLGAEPGRTSAQSDTILVSPGDQILSLAVPELLSNSKFYYCPTCSKYLKCKRSLDNHARRHLGLTPFECSECGKRFAEKGTLANHMRTHVELSLIHI